MHSSPSLSFSDPFLSHRRTEKVSAALRQNLKEIALGHLRAKKQLEDLLVKRSKALENLESTLWTVEHAAGDVEVINSQQYSLGVQDLITWF